MRCLYLSQQEKSCLVCSGRGEGRDRRDENDEEGVCRWHFVFSSTPKLPSYFSISETLLALYISIPSEEAAGICYSRENQQETPAKPRLSAVTI